MTSQSDDNKYVTYETYFALQEENQRLRKLCADRPQASFTMTC